MRLKSLLKWVNAQLIKWSSAVTTTLLLCCCSAIATTTIDVIIKADNIAYTQSGICADVIVRFLDRSYFNDEVLLSYHICGESGEMLIAENERLPLALDKDGSCSVPITVDITRHEELTQNESVIIRFDLVDQKNAYWFSTYPKIGFETTEILFDRALLTPAEQEAVPIQETEPAEESASTALFTVGFPILLNAVPWILLAILLLLVLKSRTHKEKKVSNS